MKSRVAEIALVTPSFKQGLFLRQAIDSVIGQLDVSVDYFVADAGSKDGSVEVLRSYGDHVHWRSHADAGQVHAINDALQGMQSEICGYLNSDDFLLPGALRSVVAAFRAMPDVDVIYGRAHFVDREAAIVRDYPVTDFDFDRLIQHCFICQPACFWRRRVHGRFGWFEPELDNTFDYEFWLRLAAGGAKFFHIPEYLACSRLHEATKTSCNRREIFGEIRRMQLRIIGYAGRNWWEQQLRYWRDESGSRWARLLPGKRDERLYRLAWWPYIFWRRKLGGPLFYKPGHWRA